MSERRNLPVTGLFGLVLLAGTALGVFSHSSSSLPGAWRWVGNFGAMWLAVAFFVGRISREVRTGALAGATTLAVASVVHYVPYRMARHGISWDAFRWPVVLWVGVGLLVGSMFGALGVAQARRLPRVSVVAVGFLVAAFAGEAFVLLRTGHPRAAQVAVPLELLTAWVLPLMLIQTWGDRIKTYLSGALLIPLIVFGLSAFMGVIHRVYPGV